ncbi:MAG: hypothetical protein EOP42_23685 [Sphingobacteriaceae bacterium]|nr:MAG: hypothetical protein EOP42_23685 [Sphingobacteriaceae bacterium]
MIQPKNQPRKLDIYFDHYSNLYPTSNSKIIQGICALLIFFSVLGLSWSLPFPYLQFLGQYNSYFNWASFIIAFSIYFYATLSPLLSYLMLFLALIFTYLISIVEKQFQDHLQMGELFGLIFLLSLLLHYQYNKRINSNNSVKPELSFIWIGPIWAVGLILKRFKIKF